MKRFLLTIAAWCGIMLILWVAALWVSGLLFCGQSVARACASEPKLLGMCWKWAEDLTPFIALYTILLGVQMGMVWYLDGEIARKKREKNGQQ